MPHALNGVRPINCLDYAQVMRGLEVGYAANAGNSLSQAGFREASDGLTGVMRDQVQRNQAAGFSGRDAGLNSGGTGTGPGGQTSKTSGNSAIGKGNAPGGSSFEKIV